MPSTANITDITSKFPWEFLIFSVSYVVLELGCLIIKGKLFSVIVIEHIIEIVKRVATEVFEKDVNGKKLCGILLSFALCIIFLVLLYGVHGIFTHIDAKKPIVNCALIVAFAIPTTLLYSMINESYISWVKKSRSNI